MSDPTTIVGGLIALMKRGAVTLRLHDPVASRDPTERDEIPYVSVTADGKTWAQPLRRPFGKFATTTEEIAGAIELAVDRVARPDG